jgi:hypothetical protein
MRCHELHSMRVKYTYVTGRVNTNLSRNIALSTANRFERAASKGMVKPGDDLSRIGVDRMTEAYEDIDGGDILSSFEHADVLARDASRCPDLLLGQTGFEAKLTQFGAEHAD